MKPKRIFPFLAVALALLACSLPSIPTATLLPPPSQPTDTSIPTVPAATLTTAPSVLPPTPTTAGLTLEILQNGTYFAPVFGRTVTLVNGMYSENTASGSYTVRMLDKYAFGDLNGDGLEDAGIILVENSGGTGQFESVIAVYDSGGTPAQAGQAMLGDRVLINSVSISNGVIHLDMVVHGPNDPLCCPSQAQKHSYWMIGSQLWLMRVTTTLSGTERSINIDAPANWADVTNPFVVTGNMPISPFENTLAFHIYLPDGTKVNDGSLMVNSAGMGTPGTFSHSFDLSMAGITGFVIIQFEEVSMADGSTLTLGSLVLNLH